MSDLLTYDPDWRRRFNRMVTILDTLPETAWEVRLTAVGALQRAYESRFRTAAELADFQFGSLKRSAFQAGFMLALQPLRSESTREDVEQVWREAEDAISSAKREAARRPVAHPPGLTAFGLDNATGVSRSLETFEYERPGLQPQVWKALVERQGSETHLCLVALRRQQSVFNGFDHLATAAYQRLLAPPSWRPWTGVGPHRMQFYSYVPWALHDTGSELFHARHLTWRRDRYVEDFEKRSPFETVPAGLAELDPSQAKPKGLLLIPSPNSQEASP